MSASGSGRGGFERAGSGHAGDGHAGVERAGGEREARGPRDDGDSGSGREASGPREESEGGSEREVSGPRDKSDGGSDGGAAAASTGASAGAFSTAADPSIPVDSFDPFESFDAHDRAAGREPSARSGSSGSGSRPPSGPRFGSRSGARRVDDAADASPADGESTYTRSRRRPGETDPTSTGSSRQRPTRSLKGRALAYLSRREHSRAELSRKLQPFVEESDSLDTLLDTLEQEGWLSDSRFTESVVHRRASRLGANRIVGELKRQGVGSALIEETAAQLRETELARAQAVWRKKYGQLPDTPAERAKQARFLVSRGFSQAVVSRILKGIDEDWSAD
ncbi:Regulatory protein RecX [Paraburkholderia solisilvae]|uniref:Regulatory protein RecX n=2 Tax=Paraburkholderia solisilvae TaxID=624376 RepID=A0A6J5DQK2_9BURK|nr:Regulatory protein RecX [Paraburkholderia solisilvae]